MCEVKGGDRRSLEGDALMGAEVTPLMLAELLIEAAGVTNDAEKARVLMRARDALWRATDYWGAGFARVFGAPVEEMIEDDASTS
jgi:hypothetical protein